MMLNFNVLNYTFPGCVWWPSCADLVGLNFKTKQIFVIEGGMHSYDDLKWLVHCYQLDKIPRNWKRLKHQDFDSKIIEKWYQLV